MLFVFERNRAGPPAQPGFAHGCRPSRPFQMATGARSNMQSWTVQRRVQQGKGSSQRRSSRGRRKEEQPQPAAHPLYRPRTTRRARLRRRLGRAEQPMSDDGGHHHRRDDGRPRDLDQQDDTAASRKGPTAARSLAADRRRLQRLQSATPITDVCTSQHSDRTPATHCGSAANSHLHVPSSSSPTSRRPRG